MRSHCKKCGCQDIVLPLADHLLVECRGCGATLGSLADWKAYLADQAFSPELKAREALRIARQRKR